MDRDRDGSAEIARRRALLVAALGFAPVRMEDEPSALAALKGWLRSWCGVGGNLQLTKYADVGWRANFYPAGLAHSIVGGTGRNHAPWSAVQAAAWQALGRD